MEENSFVRRTNFANIFIFLFVIGTIFRVPVTETATVSISEIMMLLGIVILPILFKSKLIKINRFEVLLVVFILFLAISTLFTIANNTGRIANILLLVVYLYIGIYLLFFFKLATFSNKVHYKALVYFSLYLSISTFYYNILNFNNFQRVGILQFGSINYLSAIMLIIIPMLFVYVRERVDNKLNVYAYISLIFMIISIIFSGSRTNIIILLLQMLFYVFAIKSSMSKRIKLMFYSIIFILLVYNTALILNPELQYLIERYVAFFTNNYANRMDIVHSDMARENLKNNAFILIGDNILFGTGFARLPNSGMPIHNFIYEIMLGLGVIGFGMYIIYVMIFLRGAFKRTTSYNSTKRYLLIMVLSFFLIGLYHPFMTTGKEFNFIFWLNIISFMNLRIANKSYGEKKHGV